MFVKQLYTNCLSEAAYFIESEGEAAVVDPLRDIDEYLKMAEERKVKIRYIFETHFHADFVSGHLDLAAATGASIVFGPGAKTNFTKIDAADGQVFQIGKISLEVLHTPGHTLESSCFLLKDEAGKPHAIFTGDTLFVGDVGRPDLSSGNMSSEELAGIMYETLSKRILPLPDDVIVYPAHGPGSSCGKSLGPNTTSTIGEERKTNHALQPQSKDAFIKSVTTGLNAAPKYFPINAEINQKGYDALQKVLERGAKKLSVSEFKAVAKDNDALIIDTRHATIFTHGFIPGSLFIGLEGRFAEWAGIMLPFHKPLLLVTPEGKENETVIRLARVGFDKIIGVLNGGFESWSAAGEPIDMIIDVEADELIMDIPHDPNIKIVDVRKQPEYASGHLEDAELIPVDQMTDPLHLAGFEDNQNIYVHCAGGYRSVIATSIMKREGLHNVRNVLGGWGKIKDTEGAKIVKEASVLN